MMGDSELYRLKKEHDGEETAMLLCVIFFALCIVVAVSLISEHWIVPWLMR
jgi:hypothetical protein